MVVSSVLHAARSHVSELHRLTSRLTLVTMYHGATLSYPGEESSVMDRVLEKVTAFVLHRAEGITSQSSRGKELSYNQAPGTHRNAR